MQGFFRDELQRKIPLEWRDTIMRHKSLYNAQIRSDRLEDTFFPFDDKTPELIASLAVVKRSEVLDF